MIHIISAAPMLKLEETLQELVDSIPADQLQCPIMVTPAVFNKETEKVKRFIIRHEMMHAIFGVLNPRR